MKWKGRRSEIGVEMLGVDLRLVSICENVVGVASA